MPDVFISYARESASTARRVATLLGDAGHDVWLDADLPPHRAYSDVIREKLEASRAVLVLWSAQAAKSEWVRAEADFARNQHKLVQATLDNVEPPLPFNQIQCALLKGWRGDPRNHEWRKLAAAVADMAGKPGDDTVAKDSRPRRAGPALIGVAAAAALLIAAGLWIAWDRLSPTPKPDPTKVAILPFETLSAGQEAQFVAQGVTDKILTTLSSNHIEVVSNRDAAALRGPDKRRKVRELGVALLLDGAVQADDKTLDVRVHLDDPAHQVVLWSMEAEGAVADQRRLQGRVAATVVGVLACSRRALQPGSGLSDPGLLSRYLRACDIFVNQGDASRPQDTFEMLAALREVVAKAPAFAAAHADLAKFDAYLAPVVPPDQAKVFREEAGREATRALALEPRSPDAFLARAMLLDAHQWADRERLLRQGVAADPAWPHTNGFLGKLLASTGRLKDAVSFSQKAAAADLQIDWSEENAWIETAAGQPEPAGSVLAKDFDMAPTNIYVWSRLFQVYLYAGRWADARAILAAPVAQAISRKQRETLAAFIAASESHAAGDVGRARAAALASPDERNGLSTSIEVLSSLGYLDDAFRLADRLTAGQPMSGVDTAVLFFPLTEKMRRDPRFMALAARLGLVAFWQASGRWPDFCADRTLPYDCRIEAARLSGART